MAHCNGTLPLCMGDARLIEPPRSHPIDRVQAKVGNMAGQRCPGPRPADQQPFSSEQQRQTQVADQVGHEEEHFVGVRWLGFVHPVGAFTMHLMIQQRTGTSSASIWVGEGLNFEMQLLKNVISHTL